MGAIHRPQPVKLFIGVLSSVAGILPEVECRLTAFLGHVDLRSEAFPFESTHYYDNEVGSPIRRNFLGFSDLIGPDQVAAIKVKTNELEAQLAEEFSQVQRPANLDPGYLEQSKIVLASTKNFYHRLYLSEGIYAEVTLHFEGGDWKALPWTFPDFRSGLYNVFFTELRNIYRDQLKSEAKTLKH
ncbi:MAG TPA: DUF4416 family protein [Acidobacteriota bacterium]|nr:DUF4416 family protein [Acidobacteriota bacterium]